MILLGQLECHLLTPFFSLSHLRLMAHYFILCSTVQTSPHERNTDTMSLYVSNLGILAPESKILTFPMSSKKKKSQGNALISRAWNRCTVLDKPPMNVICRIITSWWSCKVGISGKCGTMREEVVSRKRKMPTTDFKGCEPGKRMPPRNLEKCSANYCFQAKSISITLEHVRHAHPWPHFRCTDQKFRGWDPAICFNKPFERFWGTLNFVNHYLRK